MAKVVYKKNGHVNNVARLRYLAIAGWLVAVTLSVIMMRGAF